MSCCKKISLCPHGPQGPQGTQGDIGPPTNKFLTFVPYQSGQQAEIIINKSNGKPDRVSAIMSSDAVTSIHYGLNQPDNTDSYNITDNSLLAGITFITPRKGKILNLAIKCVASNNAANTGVIDVLPDTTITLYFQLYTTHNLNDNELLPLSNSKITFTHTGKYKYGDVLGNANISLNEDINAGSQIALIFWGELSNGLDDKQNNKGYFAIVGGMDITQEI